MNFRLLILSVLFVVLGSPLIAQEWLTDYDTAMAKAIDQDKHVLLFFTGSDWCPPCKRIKKDIYTSKEFIDYAAENLVLLLADFPKRKANQLSNEQVAKNRKLSSIYSPRGFPTTIILDNNGKEKKRWVGYRPGTPEEYIEKFNNAFGR